MVALNLDKLPAEATSLRLYRIDKKDRLIACEGVRFPGGHAAVNTVLRRGGIAGLVDVGGNIQDHFADVLDDTGTMVQTVALDAGSYRALKTKWMPCKVEVPA